MYRAIPKSSFVSSDHLYSRQSTSRLPSNIPYVVDNLLEYFRPEGLPSRRHAIYASATPDEALQNASAGGVDRSDYIVCEVLVAPEDVFAVQLKVTDARHHEDLRMLTRFVNELKIHERFSLEDRQGCALLFTPGLTKQEIDAIAHNVIVQALLKHAKANMTFWGADSASCVFEAGGGELFFELKEGATYRLAPV